MGRSVTADVALFAEARAAIGTGHLVETFAIAGAAASIGLRVKIVVPADAPATLLERAPVPVELVASFAPDVLRRAGQALRAEGIRLATTNMREITNEQVRALAAAGIDVICVDELGDRHLDCLVVVNPSAVAGRRRSASTSPAFRIYGGPEYLALGGEYASRHATPRQFTGPLRSLVVTMGGVDRTRATLRIVEALADWRPAVERHVVVGAAADWEDELARLIARSPTTWAVHRNPPSLADLLGQADVGLTAGGNTLLEMACLGTPALILHEDPHEEEQARALAAEGFGEWLGRGVDVSASRLHAALDRLDDPTRRRAQSAAGRRLVDGQGATRIARLLAEHLAGVRAEMTVNASAGDRR